MYADWCQHCQHFKPLYKELAAFVRKRDPSMKFYMLEHNGEPSVKGVPIAGYPTMVSLHKHGEVDRGKLEDMARSILE